MSSRFMMALLAAGLAGAAERPVATITCSDTFALNGTKVAASGVSSWPLMPGDQVTTLASDAVIRFQDNTRIALAKGAQLKVEGTKDNPTIRLANGAMSYKVQQNSPVHLFAGSEAVKVKYGSESGVSVEGGKVQQAQGPRLEPENNKGHKPPRGRSSGEDDGDR